MIRKLRRRFIVASMLSLFTVLLVIMSLIGVINYNHIIKRADNTLKILSDNNGRFPKINKEEQFLNPNKRDNLEIPYESRYFSVVVNEGEIVISVDTGRVAAINSSTAIDYALKALDTRKESGFLEDYRYKINSTDDGIRIIFLDVGRQLDTFRTFIISAMIISAVSIMIVFILIWLTSEKIIKPVSESYEKQKRFITDAGHEIKTPLTIINADAQILEMDIGENEWLQDIQNQTKRLTDLSNDLTILARMDEEQINVPMIDFPISDLVEEISQSFSARAKVEEKGFNSKIEPMISFKGDEKSIRQLLSILLDNALKYTDKNGNIDIELNKNSKNINLTVKNTTEFISKDSIEHLFDRFYRTDKSRNSKTGGYGLGLSIAMAIVIAHKGKIQAITEDEKSLSIQVKLPLN